MDEEKAVYVKDEDETRESLNVEHYEQWMALPVEQRVCWDKYQWRAVHPSEGHPGTGSLPTDHALYAEYQGKRMEAHTYALQRTSEVYLDYIRHQMSDFVHNTRSPGWAPCEQTIAAVRKNVRDETSLKIHVMTSGEVKTLRVDTFHPIGKRDDADISVARLTRRLNGLSEATRRLVGGGKIYEPKVKQALYVGIPSGAEVDVLGERWFVSATALTD